MLNDSGNQQKQTNTIYNVLKQDICQEVISIHKATIVAFCTETVNKLPPPIFKSWFSFCSDLNNYRTV